MFGMFRKKVVEVWRVEVQKPFTDVYLGMGYDEHHRKVKEGAKGIAEITDKGKVTITFEDIPNTPYMKEPLKVYFNKGDESESNFKYVELITKDPEGVNIKKSSLFG